MLFLSYAEEDGARASEIAACLREQGIHVYLWEDVPERGGRFIRQMERQLNSANGFLALDSPHFTASPWCHRETELAILREVQLQRTQPDASFIRVLKLADTPHRDIGFLDAYDRYDLSDPGRRADELRKLRASLGPAPLSKTGVRTEEPAEARPSPPTFRNRDDELDNVLRGMTNSAGPHFWLVIAPPQLGKTWFLDQLALRIGEDPGNWSARRVNVRDYPDDARSDVPWLLGQLFMFDGPSVSVEPEALERIATEILRRRRPHLCMLDSAELLSAETVHGLQKAVSEIHRMVLEGDDRNVRIAFAVASRRDDEWRRVSRHPRLSLLPLSEFKLNIVTASLSDLAAQMGRPPGRADAHAAAVYRVSEGLPALLTECLQWIQLHQWVGMNLLNQQSQFEELAGNYINEGLLGSANLFRTSRPPDAQARLAIERALRGLAPYRLFTLAHLRDHVESDALLTAMLDELRWSVERLWGEVSSTALLARPLKEPWQEVQGAIRRLLFRHFYRSDAERAEAHTRARRFAGIWSDGLIGNDQVTGLVECLWHEAAELSYRGAPDITERLCESASLLVELLKPSAAYTGPELRISAAERMRNNDEFQGTVAHVPGLFDKLVRIVDAPEGG
jgi:TIR domain